MAGSVPNIPLRTVRVLVTGAGGPAAVSVMKSLGADPSVSVIAADMDPWAAGLYLVPPDQRTLVPAGAAPEFVDVAMERCLELGVDVLIPTCDAELQPLGQARADFRRAGVELLLAPDHALEVCLDKLALAERCAGHVPVPRTERLDKVADPGSWAYPVMVKPRRGSGSRGISVITSSQDLARLEASADYIVQDYLPGAEYSIDVLADITGHVVASVPRVRERVDSGVSVAGRTLHDEELERLGAAVAAATGLTYVANVQFRRDAVGRPALLEVNPRFPGTMPLTVASGVDMPLLALDSLRGKPLPEQAGFREVAMVRYLEERFLELGEVQQVAA
ncbi:MAG TPA: ATP-grasp domain-containing protein [Streptosporangiaceae bacterium]|nr:ATP-grasp domain-containing protein [Streptosporangiaceae bacterium]